MTEPANPPGIALTDAELAKIPDRQDGVEYRRHPVWTDYIVGTDGSVHSTLLRRINAQSSRRLRPIFYRLKGSPDQDGYLHVSMRKDGHFKSAPIHRMVLDAFVGPKPDGLWGLHVNDVKLDNRLSNLEYGTPKRNTAQRIQNGKPLHGVNNPAARLVPDQVKEIRAFTMYRGGVAELMDRFKISRPLITKIRNGSIWGHIV